MSETDCPKPGRLLRVDQVAECLNCSKRQVYYLIDSAKLPALSIGKNQKKGYRVPESGLEAFILNRIREFWEEVGLNPDEFGPDSA